LSLRVVFMGTPEFAVPGLAALLDAGCDVVGVVSQPSKPVGRGLQVQAPPVAAFAASKGLPVHQWPRLSNESFEVLSGLAPELCVVIAYGRILPRRYLDLPRHGCLNVHASLLPRWRGAAPIQWAVIDGDARTGVCVMRMAEGLDTGPVACTLETDIGPDETSGALHDRLAVLGAQALRQTLDALSEGPLTFVDQPETGVTYARRLEKLDGQLDWTWSARRVHDRVRGTSPWPGAFVDRPAGPLKIHATRVVDSADTGGALPGTIVGSAADGPIIACGTAAVVLSSVQRAGRKVVSGAEFLRGATDLVPGARL